jgi:very-short-patch-repair endonuclease
MKKHPAGGAIRRARALRRDMTEAERKIWKMFRSRRFAGYKLRRQVPLERYIVDFACHEARLVIEIDGGQHGSSSESEIERSEFLKKEGYKILRFWNNEVLANPEGVLSQILDVLLTDHPHPNPLPSRERV